MKKSSDEPLSFQVADKIRFLIRKAEMVSGTRLNEQELCKRFDVSRTPLREAFRMLSAEGLVKILPNRGTFIDEPSLEDVLNMFEAMGFMEGICACLTCERLTDADLMELESLHDRLEDYYKNSDHESYMDCNHEYHMFIQEKAGNPVLARMVSNLRDMILLHRYRQIYRPGRFLESIEEHRRLIEAFRARNGERAERLMRTHLHKQGQALISYYAEHGYSLKHTDS